MNQNNLREVENGREALACMFCGKDLLETGYGVFILVRLRDCSPSQFIGGYWACRGVCDMVLEAAFDATTHSTGWQGIDKLTNPLIYKAWYRRTERLIGNGCFSPPAAATVRQLKSKLARAASKKPTHQDVVEFRLWRMMDEL